MPPRLQRAHARTAHTTSSSSSPSVISPGTVRWPVPTTQYAWALQEVQKVQHLIQTPSQEGTAAVRMWIWSMVPRGGLPALQLFLHRLL
eukprot:1820713-Pyramimonas_sp.AAC.1